MRIIAHILAIVAFLTLPALRYPMDVRGFLAMDIVVAREIFGNGLIVFFFYLNLLVLVPRLYMAGRLWYYAVALLLCYLACALTPPSVFRPGAPMPAGVVAALHLLPEEHTTRGAALVAPGHWGGIAYALAHELFVFVAATAVSVNMRLRTQARKLEQEKTSTELSYLRAQVDPHFLFNTLNSIYALALTDAENAPEAILKLSGLMRYVMVDSQKASVPLEAELNYIIQYVDLQVMRIGPAVELSFECQGETEGLEIAPLILVSFIENAFKYGVNPERRSQIRIFISIDKDDLSLSVFNAKSVVAGQEASSHGIGVSNTLMRLRMIYPNRHDLIVHDKADSYLVNLIINLKPISALQQA